MIPSVNFLSVMIFMGMAQGLFVATALWTLKPKPSAAPRILSIFLLLFALNSLDDLLISTRLITYVPHLTFVLTGAFVLLAPFFWLYIVALTTPDFQFSFRFLWHLLPAALFYLCIAPFFLLSADQKLAYVLPDVFSATKPDMPHPFIIIGLQVFSVFLRFQVVTYWAVSMYRLRQHAERIQQTHSALEKVSLVWIQRILWLVLIECGIFVATFFIESEWLNTTSIIATTALFYAFGYAGFNQPDVFTGFRNMPPDLTAPNTPGTSEALKIPNALPALPLAEFIDRTTEIPSQEQGRKYEKSTLTDGKAAAVLTDLRRRMETQKPYLNPELTLQDLADNLGISTHHLSQVLNSAVGQSFYDFINAARIEAVKTLLLNPRKQNLTIIAIAYECGFNSKAAFQTAFKKHTGQTPSEFRKLHLLSIMEN